MHAPSVRTISRLWLRRTGVAIVGVVLLFVSPRMGSTEELTTRNKPPFGGHAALESGVAVGEIVPQFYSRVVTGPLMNRSTCFVCRYGERPVVMVLMRKVGPELRPLLKNVDRIVERHRAGGLRSFGVLVSDDAFPAISSVQTFAFNTHLSLPLTVGTEAVGAESCQNLSPDAAVTVVFYARRKVIERFALRADELDVAHYTPLVESLKSFAAERAGSDVLPTNEPRDNPQ